MDFYVILGVGPDASAADIKRAYRRLSRRYHPGVNPGDRAAEEMFRRIAEAYATLSDPPRRRDYDTGDHDTREAGGQPDVARFTEFDFSGAASGPQAATFTELFADILHPGTPRDFGDGRGSDIHATLTVDFADAMSGVERQIVVTRQVPCRVCRGRGQVAARETRCRQCQATGVVRWARGHMVFSKVCRGCGGTGQQRVQACGTCAGTGRTVCSEAVAVQVPPGTADGDQLRIAEVGHAGRAAAPNGDLYVTVTVPAHPFFRREGDTLSCVVPIAVHEAVLGARIDVPTPDGPVRMRVPPGTQAGQRFRIAGRGIPARDGSRGDLIVEARLVLPDTVDERSKELMREFGARNQQDVRSTLHAALRT